MIQRVAMGERSSLRRDVISAYIASGAKIASWVVVSAVVFRYRGPGGLGFLALLRATVGLLNYTTLGLAPATIHFLSRAKPAPAQILTDDSAVLHYHRPEPLAGPDQFIFGNAAMLAFVLSMLGLPLIWWYAVHFERLHDVPSQVDGQASLLVLVMGCGVLLRLVGDPLSAVLQVRGRIALDNLFIAITETCWVLLTPLLIFSTGDVFEAVISAFAIASGVLLSLRIWAGLGLIRRPAAFLRLVNPAILWSLLSFGGMVTLASLADFLYAPTDFILINHYISAGEVGRYAPAVQIDAGLLVLVIGLANVLLPRSAVAHAAGSLAEIRRNYLWGTLLSAGMLAIFACGIWVLSPLIFRLWLGNPMAETQAILPLVLVHTVVGGSSAVGRSILLGIGRVRAFTAAVLIAGASNVLLSWYFVAHLKLGLRGIVCGTIIAVVGRCAIWMPWYTLRVLRREAWAIEASERPSPQPSPGIPGEGE